MKAKREAHVELARILACMIVVGVHVCLPQIVNDQPDLGRTFISCFLADGVAVFWLRGRKIFCVYGEKSSLIRTRYV